MLPVQPVPKWYQPFSGMKSGSCHVVSKLEGQYGLRDVYLGVPVKLGKNGIESVIELKLTSDEMALLHESSGHVKEVMSAYDKMGLS